MPLKQASSNQQTADRHHEWLESIKKVANLRTVICGVCIHGTFSGSLSNAGGGLVVLLAVFRTLDADLMPFGMLMVLQRGL
jgi:hypothetical protein